MVAEGRQKLDRPLVVLAGTVVVGAVAALLDTTIVGVALDAIARDFGTTDGSVVWVTTSYLLSLALITPLVGWGADRFGSTTMWHFAIVSFLVGSVLCALAWDTTSLVVFRALKGIGGGMVLPLCQAILARAAGPERFGRAMSLVSIPGLAAPVLGPVVGGFIVDGLGWRWVFLINVPLCLLALVLALRFMPANGPRRATSVDWVGMLLLPPGLVLVVYGFSRIDSPSAFTDPVVASVLLVGVGLIAWFCVHALRVPEPLVNLRLFRFRGFSSSAALTFLHGVGSYAPLVVLPLFFTRVGGHDAATTGWLLAPQGAGTLLAVIFAGVLADRYGARPLVLTGVVGTIAGTVVFTQLSAQPHEVLLGASLFVRGLGLGLIGISVLTAAYRGMAADDIAQATGAISIVQRLGASAGAAGVAVVLAVALASISPTAAGTEVAGAYGETFWWVLGTTVLALIPAFAVPRTTKPATATAE
ncbi:EmrB/QacA subfamily drug resistance transporter [Saccharothrix carnea]|uniref:EmrB/QacA subfamily drug resistance transporter n=1 Tax=Saccharothrix carnea TaxID=1280637 RepID=A0A2P8I2K0_SACCR|nr:DHA2 family efflux MFS transporter permease subunit [Saccharothrix carnea]PSL52698.1 EmrB/QacA subfamily drug resistance transporter [Saccharothrix carnea]